MTVWDHIERRGPRDCWPFTGVCSSAGYGVVRVDGKPRYAHVLVCEELYGPMQPGEVVRHMCAEVSTRRCSQHVIANARSMGSDPARVLASGDRRCCNPQHLKPGSQRANALDRERAKRLARSREG